MRRRGRAAQHRAVRPRLEQPRWTSRARAPTRSSSRTPRTAGRSTGSSRPSGIASGAARRAPVADWAVLRFALVAERPLARRTVNPVAAEQRQACSSSILLRADADLEQGFATQDGDRNVATPGCATTRSAVLLRDRPGRRGARRRADADERGPSRVRLARATAAAHARRLRPGRTASWSSGCSETSTYPWAGGRATGWSSRTFRPRNPSGAWSAIRLLVTRIVRRATQSATVVRLALATTDGDRIPRTDDRGEIRRALAARPDGDVLVLVHGIIGDTRGMAEASDHPGGRSMREPAYDVVLTFDYENLDFDPRDGGRAPRRAARAGHRHPRDHRGRALDGWAGLPVDGRVLGSTTPLGEPAVAVHRLVTAGAPTPGGVRRGRRSRISPSSASPSH